VGKLGLTLDLSKPAGREVAVRLADWADVVVENFSPGAMDRWGLDYATLSQRNPGLVLLSTCLSGATGPHASLAGYGTMGAALAGFHELTGWPDRAPAGPFLAYTDYVSPKYVAASVLAAIDHRSRTGQGQHIDLSQGEAALHFLAPVLLDYTVNGRTRTRAGNDSEEFAPHGVYPCRGEDSWIALAVTNEEQWRSFASALGAQDWLSDNRFALPNRRRAHRQVLDSMIAELSSMADVAELEAKLVGAGVPAHRVSNSHDVMADPQLRARGHFASVNQPEVGEVLVETPRFRLSASPFVPPQPAPTLGRDNEFVLHEILGLSEDEITELVVAGALE
jgi:benzylsuccinate CoA-transferase BbsF subunit